MSQNLKYGMDSLFSINNDCVGVMAIKTTELAIIFRTQQKELKLFNNMKLAFVDDILFIPLLHGKSVSIICFNNIVCQLTWSLERLQLPIDKIKRMISTRQVTALHLTSFYKIIMY